MEKVINHSRFSELNSTATFTGTSMAIQYTSTVLNVLTFIIGLAGNAAVIGITGFILKKNKCKIWFLNLAVADLSFCLCLPLYGISTFTGNWPFGSSLCKFFNYVSTCNMYGSVFIITALSIDRVLSVAKPIWHLNVFSHRACLGICAAIWVTTFVSSLPVYFFSDTFTHDNTMQCRLVVAPQFEYCRLGSRSLDFHLPPNGPNRTETSSYEIGKEAPNVTIPGTEIGLEDFPAINETYLSSGPRLGSAPRGMAGIHPRPRSLCKWDIMMTAFLAQCILIPFLVAGYFIPLCVILSSNTIISFTVSKSPSQKTPRLYRIVIMVVLIYFLTWTPLATAEIILIRALRSSNITLMNSMYHVMPLLCSVAYTNCCLNPLIYVLVGSQVRGELSDFISTGIPLISGSLDSSFL